MKLKILILFSLFLVTSAQAREGHEVGNGSVDYWNCQGQGILTDPQGHSGLFAIELEVMNRGIIDLKVVGADNRVLYSKTYLDLIMDYNFEDRFLTISFSDKTRLSKSSARTELTLRSLLAGDDKAGIYHGLLKATLKKNVHVYSDQLTCQVYF